MAPFSEALALDVAGVPLLLATLTGACTAGELSLASDSLPFGTVVLGSRTSKRLALANSGDVGARFAWDARALRPHFEILPSGTRARRGNVAQRLSAPWAWSQLAAI
jgi:hydrocephalus-inducing protein